MADRVDVKLVEQGLAQSRERAKALVMEGVVFLDGIRVMKASDPVRPGQALSVRENPIPFVSRGGLKLQKALKSFGITLTGRVCADIGASTGGFTDCMLSEGASHVYAIDVGYGQLDWRLRNDERVSCMERHNAREMKPDWFARTPDFASIDVSFISLKLIFPALDRCLAQSGEVAALIKPQFEAGRSKVGRNGVVRDRSTHIEVLRNAVEYAGISGFTVKGIDFSPIKGPKGNIEFLMHLMHVPSEGTADFDRLIAQTVDEAHKQLG